MFFFVKKHVFFKKKKAKKMIYITRRHHEQKSHAQIAFQKDVRLLTHAMEEMETPFTE